MDALSWALRYGVETPLPRVRRMKLNEKYQEQGPLFQHCQTVLSTHKVISRFNTAVFC